jgi:hypothetical protein
MVNFEQFKKQVTKLGLGEEFSEDKLRSLHRDFLRTQGGWGLEEDVLKEVSYLKFHRSSLTPPFLCLA